MILSFGHKYGVPSTADKVFDIRDLSHQTSDPAFAARTKDVIEYAVQHPHQTIAIGCEHGNHRAYLMAHKVAGALRRSVLHRDKGR